MRGRRTERDAEAIPMQASLRRQSQNRCASTRRRTLKPLSLRRRVDVSSGCSGTAPTTSRSGRCRLVRARLDRYLDRWGLRDRDKVQRL